jgi:hypothetical protein
MIGSVPARVFCAAIDVRRLIGLRTLVPDLEKFQGKDSKTPLTPGQAAVLKTYSGGAVRAPLCLSANSDAMVLQTPVPENAHKRGSSTEPNQIVN